MKKVEEECCGNCYCYRDVLVEMVEKNMAVVAQNGLPNAKKIQKTIKMCCEGPQYVEHHSSHWCAKYDPRRFIARRPIGRNYDVTGA